MSGNEYDELAYGERRAEQDANGSDAAAPPEEPAPAVTAWPGRESLPVEGLPEPEARRVERELVGELLALRDEARWPRGRPRSG